MTTTNVAAKKKKNHTIWIQLRSVVVHQYRLILQSIIPQTERVQIIEAIRTVDLVICPCPLVVTQDFMDTHGIDLVVHGHANDADAKRQEVFFEIPMQMGKF